MFLDNEYSAELFQTMLPVPHFSNVVRKSQGDGDREWVLSLSLFFVCLFLFVLLSFGLSCPLSFRVSRA